MGSGRMRYMVFTEDCGQDQFVVNPDLRELGAEATGCQSNPHSPSRAHLHWLNEMDARVR